MRNKINKEYKLTEEMMRKIYLHLENSIIPKEEHKEEGTYEILQANQFDLLEDFQDALNINPEMAYVEAETLEIVEW